MLFMDFIPYNKDKHQKIWDDYVALHPMGCIYHLSAWSDIIKETYGWKNQFYLIFISGELKGILPFFKMRSFTQSSYYISMPFTAYAGPLLSFDANINDIFKALAWDNELVIIREFKKEPDQISNVAAMIIDLPDEAETLWNGLKKHTRKYVRRCEKEGYSFHIDGDFFHDFMTIYKNNLKRLGTPAHPSLFFKKMIEHLPENTKIWAIKDGEKVIGAQLALMYKDHFYNYTGFVLPEYNNKRAGMLMAWETIRTAIEMGYKKLDYGRSTPDTGPYNFKLQWDAKPNALNYYKTLRGKVINTGVPQPGKLSKIWTKVPVLLTDFFGPLLRKYVP